jgi:hypothetical protein
MKKGESTTSPLKILRPIKPLSWVGYFRRVVELIRTTIHTLARLLCLGSFNKS